jgi:hypothetical protein
MIVPYRTRVLPIYGGGVSSRVLNDLTSAGVRYARAPFRRPTSSTVGGNQRGSVRPSMSALLPRDRPTPAPRETRSSQEGDNTGQREAAAPCFRASSITQGTLRTPRPATHCLPFVSRARANPAGESRGLSEDLQLRYRFLDNPRLAPSTDSFRVTAPASRSTAGDPSH